MNNQKGVTIIELLAAFVIVTILLTFVVGAILFGQKIIVRSDQKNNEAAIAQDYIDEIVTRISSGEALAAINVVGTDEKGKANSMDNPGLTDVTLGMFNDSMWNKYPRQFYVVPYPPDPVIGDNIGYNIYYRSYYDNGMSQINLTAFAKKNGN